jgi:hypothetical protein
MLTRIVHNSPNYAHFSTVKPRFVQAAASAYAQPGRCAAGLRRRENVGCLATAIHRSAGCLQHGRFSAHQSLEAKRCAPGHTRQSGEVGCGTSGATGYLPKVLYINIDDSLGEKDKIPAIWNRWTGFTTTARAPKANRSSRMPFAIWKQPADWENRGHRRSALVLARKRPCGGSIASASPGNASPFAARTIWPAQHIGNLAPAAARGLAGLCAVRQLVRFRAVDQICPSPRLACDLRPQSTTASSMENASINRFRSQAQAVHQVRVTAADGNKTTYYVRQTTGRLEKVPFDVRVFFSKRHPRDKSPAYFMSTDLTRSAQQALQGYSGRWSCEVVNFYLKTQLGLADFRVQSYQAVDKYMVVVLLTWAYVERRFEQERSAQIKTYGDLIRRHRDEHAVAVADRRLGDDARDRRSAAGLTTLSCAWSRLAA